MELPDVYVNPINKDIKNVQKKYEGAILDRSYEDKIPLINKINSIFSAKDFVYKKRVRITTINGKNEYVIIGKTNRALLTFEGKRILINDIYDIEVI